MLICGQLRNFINQQLFASDLRWPSQGDTSGRRFNVFVLLHRAEVESIMEPPHTLKFSSESKRDHRDDGLVHLGHFEVQQIEFGQLDLFL